MVTIGESGGCRWHVLPMSGSAVGQLDQAADVLLDLLRIVPQLPMAPLARLLQSLHVREDVPELRRAYILDGPGRADVQSNPAFCVEGAFAGPCAEICPVFMFPGVGEQHIGMADALYRTEPVFREYLEECAYPLRDRYGFDLIAQLYPPGLHIRDADPGAAAPTLDLRNLMRDSHSLTSHEEAAARTVIAHPMLFCVEYALARMWMARGVVPRAMIGHSLGEYVAACISGVMSAADAMSVVYERARLIEELSPSAMLAVAATPTELETFLPGGVDLAAVNAPALCVISGPRDSIASLRTTLSERGIVHRTVNASHAFHSRMMGPIRGELEKVLRGVALRAPSIPYISNLTGDWIRPEQAMDPLYWLDHTCKAVRFGAGIHALYTQGARVFLEVGPARILGSFVMQALADEANASVTVISTLPGPNETIASDYCTARAEAMLWCVGALPDWGNSTSSSDTTAVAPAKSDVQEPTGDIEPILAAIWERVLGCKNPGRNDDFFRLGGTSLTALRVATHIRERLNLEVTLRVLFEYPTLRSLAGWVEHALLSEILDSTGQEVNGAVPADAASGGPISLCLPNGQHVLQFNRVETEHFYLDIFEKRVYARNGVVLEGEPVVFDVGANIGLFSLFVRHHAKAARIFAFEPAPPTFDLLRRNLTGTSGENHLFNVGLADRPGRMSLTFYPRSTGMSTFRENESEERLVLESIMRNQFASDRAGMSEAMQSINEILDLRFESTEFECPIRTVSEVIHEYALERVDLIKIDVQKCERAVLDGIDREHWPRIRQIVVEVHDIDGRVDEIARLLGGHGFEVIIEQDELYKGSNIHNVYAIRPVLAESRVRAQQAQRLNS
jgi:phthiocerol/phenolphthiocerol synthesis type-I polyketide synthase E